MAVLVGRVIQRRNVLAEGDLQRSTLTLDRATIDGLPVDASIELASKPVPAQEAYRTLTSIEYRAVVVIEGTPSVAGEPWAMSSIVATTRSEDARLETIASTASPARHPSDVVNEGDQKHLVPDIFREEPMILPGIGLAWARYTRRSDLCFEPDGYFTEPLDQHFLPVDDLEVCIIDDSDLTGTARCIREFANADRSLRDHISPHVFAYYQDVRYEFGDQPGFPTIATATEIWDHLTFRAREIVHDIVDGTHYLKLEADCSWEPEHGLQLTFVDGHRLCRVSPYDGHPLNMDPGVIFEPVFGPETS